MSELVGAIGILELTKIAGISLLSQEMFMKVNRGLDILDNVNNVYQAGKKIKNKNKRVSYMGKAYKFVAKVLYEMAMEREHRKEERAEYRHERLAKYRRDKKRVEDEMKEVELFEKYGMLKDSKTKMFITPAQLLTDIHSAVLKSLPSDAPTELKSQLRGLVLGRDTAFDEVEDYFVYVDVPERSKKKEFYSRLLPEVYSIESILLLKKKKAVPIPDSVLCENRVVA